MAVGSQTSFAAVSAHCGPLVPASRRYTPGRVLLTSSSSVPLLLIISSIVPSSPCAWIRSRPDLDSLALTLFQHSVEPRAQESSADATSARRLKKPSNDLAPIVRGPLQVGPRSGPSPCPAVPLLYIDYFFPLSSPRPPLLFSILVSDSLSPFLLPLLTISALPSPSIGLARALACPGPYSIYFHLVLLGVPSPSLPRGLSQAGSPSRFLPSCPLVSAFLS